MPVVTTRPAKWLSNLVEQAPQRIALPVGQVKAAASPRHKAATKGVRSCNNGTAT